ncbi:MAG TPA: hypothetical protein VK864_12115 [Longimicrobiales bacterium]|nr:hypothetical protein [Longimicrobiales bacterium]
MTISTPTRLGLAALLFAWPLYADDLTGADAILCSAVEATQCSADGECASGPPWNWKFPQFLEIDLKKNVVSTTQASGENRSTPIRNTERSEGKIVLQGVQQGRAFSFVIVEQTGMASAAIAAEGMTVTVFAACTPMTRR